MKKNHRSSSTARHAGERKLLNAAGLKITAPRLRLLRILSRQKYPLSVQEIYAGARYMADQATVYRCLQKLVDHELVRQIDLRKGFLLYELADAHDHHHMVCTECGQIEDFTGCVSEQFISKALKNSKYFNHIKQHSLELYGICKKCAS